LRVKKGNEKGVSGISPQGNQAIVEFPDRKYYCGCQYEKEID
jgi:CTP synthase (UTP-ammonia lyase)